MVTPSFGIIVGRFQVPQLHEAHMELFRVVRSRHNRIVVFLGVARTGPTRENPMDFVARKRMIQSLFPDITVLPILDQRSDQVWSELLDSKIAEVATWGQVTLYGGRDSFAPRYHGKYKPVELDLAYTADGTSIREAVTNTVLDSPEFRHGIIYAVNNTRPHVYPTVDVAVLFSAPENDYYLLLGQKPGEDKWRFIGGFCEPASKSFEEDAKRETYEETNLSVDSLKYAGSTLIQDWRYPTNIYGDRIRTTFFVGWTVGYGYKAGDDLAKCAWYHVAGPKGYDLGTVRNALVPEHQPLCDLLERYVETELKWRKAELEHAAPKTVQSSTRNG